MHIKYIYLLRYPTKLSLTMDLIPTFNFQEGNASKSVGPLIWTEPPVALAHDSPYLIGLLKKTVEIRTDQPSLLIQTLELADPKLIVCHKPGLTFVASSSQVKCFISDN